MSDGKGHVSYMNLINGFALYESLVAQWLEGGPGVVSWEVMGSMPVGYSVFFFVPR